jgi:hypothetical protein
VQLDDMRAAGAAMKAVHVLGDEAEPRDARREQSERVVGGVRLRLEHGVAAHPVPVPHEPRVTLVRLGSRQLLGAVAGPQAGQSVAEGGDPALG